MTDTIQNSTASTSADRTHDLVHHDVSPDRMRSIMGSFASGVTVITAEAESGPAGFTCQSFTSLSLFPPLITFNPTRASTTWPRIRAVGSFVVNILGAGHEHLSRAFARSGTEKFAGVDYVNSPTGHPRLSEALAWIECSLHKEYDGGDHTIVVASVKAMSAIDDLEPLLFFRGGYRELSPGGPRK